MPDDTDAQKKEIAQADAATKDAAAQTEQTGEGVGPDAQKKEADQV